MSLKPPYTTSNAQINAMFRELYGKVGVLEPTVAAQQVQLTKVSGDVAAQRGILFDVLSEGVPQAQVGDAVHLDSATQTIFRGDPVYRNTIVGVKQGDGRVISTGPAVNLKGLVAGSTYYVTLPTPTAGVVITGSSTGYLPFRKDNTNYGLSQSFTGADNKVLAYVRYPAYQAHSGGITPAYPMHLELRSDDGAGKPTAVVLDRAAALYPSNGSVVFVFYGKYRLSAGVIYHLVFNSDTMPVNGTDYMEFVYASGNPYADGQSCYCSNVGAWTVNTGWDLLMSIYWYDLLDTSIRNISATHPFVSANGPASLFQPVIEVGQAVSDTVLNVSVRTKAGVLIYSDTTSEIQYAGGTTYARGTFGGPVYQKELNLTGFTKVALFLQQRINNVAYIGYVRPWLNGVLGTEVTTQNGYYNNEFSQIQTQLLPMLYGNLSVGFMMKTNNASGQNLIKSWGLIGV